MDSDTFHNGAELRNGFIYEIADFPNLPNEYGVKKFWGIPTTGEYTRLDLTLDRDIRSFVYNIGYITHGNLTAATFDIWFQGSGDERTKLEVDSTWNNIPWKKTTIGPVKEVSVVLTGFYSRSGILAFYDWGYED